MKKEFRRFKGFEFPGFTFRAANEKKGGKICEIEFRVGLQSNLARGGGILTINE